MRLILLLWARWCAFYYAAARDSLTRRAPTHPDLPEVTLLAAHWRERAESLWGAP
jgi:hypothetical protein